MASKSHTVKFPPDLYDVMTLRATAAGYRTVSAYLKGLVRYDALVQGSHPVTLPMSNLPDTQQDAIDAQLLKATQAGIGQRGQLLTRIIERAKESGDPASAETIIPAITKKRP